MEFPDYFCYKKNCTLQTLKKLISIFFISLMCVQLLPIAQVGKLLFNNQIVEEHVSGDCMSKTLKLSPNDLNFHRYSDQVTALNPELFLRTLSYSYHEDIPASPIQEIQTPPPNHIG